MAVYIIGVVGPLICQLLISAIQTERKKKLVEKMLLVFLFIYFFVLAIGRDYVVGTDMGNYIRRYYLVTTYGWKDLYTMHQRWGFEYGYLIATKLMSMISMDPRFYIICTGGFITISFQIAIKRWSKSPCVSWSLLNLLMFYPTAFNLIRMFTAIGIILFAIPYIKHRKFIKFMLLTLLATSFHTTAILFFPLYWLVNIRLTKITLIWSTVCCLALYIFSSKVLVLLLRFFATYYSTRYESNIGSGSGLGMLILLISIFTYSYFYKDFMDYDDEYNDIWMHMLLGAIFLNMLTFNLMIAGRLMWYLKIALVFLIPNMISSVRIRIKSALVNLFFYLSVFAVLMYYFALMMSTDTAGVVPYVFGMKLWI